MALWPTDFDAALGWFQRVLSDMPAAFSEEDLLPRPAVRSQAAVLMVLVWHGDVPQLMLTRRTEHLRSHAGQISLPGGRLEPGDAGVIGCALRETQEEVGLPPDLLQIAGVMPSYVTVTGYEVTPVLGLMREPFDPQPAADEVAEVFFVPLSLVLDVSAYERHAVERDGVRGHYYALTYRGYFIWGATAAMLRRLALQLAA